MTCERLETGVGSERQTERIDCEIQIIGAGFRSASLAKRLSHVHCRGCPRIREHSSLLLLPRQNPRSGAVETDKLLKPPSDTIAEKRYEQRRC